MPLWLRFGTGRMSTLRLFLPQICIFTVEAACLPLSSTNGLSLAPSTAASVSCLEEPVSFLRQVQRFRHLGRQPGTSDATVWLLKHQPPSRQSGYGTSTLHLFLLQVSYLPHAKCYQSDDVFLFAVPHPFALQSPLCCVLESTSSVLAVIQSILMFAGDIQLNPGPKTTVPSSAVSENRVSGVDNEVLAFLTRWKPDRTNYCRSLRIFNSNKGKLMKCFQQLTEKLLKWN